MKKMSTQQYYNFQLQAQMDRRKANLDKAREAIHTPTRSKQAQEARDEIADYLARNPTRPVF